MNHYSDGPNMSRDSVTFIRPKSGWQLSDLGELKEYRDLFYFLVWRDIKVLYAQTILGFSWAILNPLTQIIIFSVIFGKVAKLSTEGIPYLLYSTVAIVPWTYMSEAMTQASQSLISGQGMLGKIYFPRLLFPLTPVLSKLLDFGISLLIILAVMVYYRVAPTWNLLLLPFFLIVMMSIPAAVGMLLASLSIRFRDVKFAMPFIIRMLMYTAPIIYSASAIPDSYRFIYSLNPLVGVIEGMRASLLGTPVPWLFILPGISTSIVMLIAGLLYFKHNEQIFVDVI
jgi:lipopolysaccharide transport system permease protein